ncbi:MAG: Leucyl-tRNA ligase LeuS, partial [Parcubacteria group bacterium GW2011_GWB1_37_13]
MAEYNHLKIEKKWQKEWEKRGIYYAQNKSKKPKYYSLIEFPYPSGDGLHVGHPRPYIGMDIISRKRRLQGFNVLYPIGWDAFGLPTENYAIKTGLDPRIVTKKNSDTFRRQIKSLGISFDWSREINTTDSKYYKWTQWIFLQFLKKSLAYKEKMTINWCPKDKIGLANEEVVNGCCERCGTSVEKREKEQWMLAITKYADRLYKDLDDVDYLPQIKLGQRNWIGKSEGAEINFQINSSPISQGVVKIFTTRPDTIFGATYLVLAPEHKLVQKLKPQIANWNEVEKYIKEIKNKIDIERTGENKAKTGIELKKIKAINPATKKEIPVWIADYILVTYGTGAIMAVPAHDERDFEFAKKYNLPIRHVIAERELKQLYSPKEGLPFVYRKAVECHVRNPKNNKFLYLDWKVADWNSPVTGGIEGDENLVDAALREIHEETGYKNLKFIQELGGPIRADFYHPHKKENRRADFYGVLFELENEDRDEIPEEELTKHESVWIPKDQIQSFSTISPIFFNRILNQNLCFTGNGVLINSGKFNDMDSEQAKKEIIKFVGGKEKTTFKLRDWIFSRQRYWGEPIPVVHCEKCGIVPIPEKNLPVKLPKVKNYQPTDSGESPLANISKWVNTKCPKCKGKARRETDTMPNWAGSSWYYLRYTDSKNDKEFASKKNLEYWLSKKELGTPTTKWKSDYQVGGVDWYNGGNEHTTLHLLYSRFWHKFLYDLKLVPTSEPYMKRTSHGMILGEGGVKMSKSLGNVINPDDIVKTYGADTLRIYEMFMGPFD